MPLKGARGTETGHRTSCHQPLTTACALCCAYMCVCVCMRTDVVRYSVQSAEYLLLNHSDHLENGARHFVFTAIDERRGRARALHKGERISKSAELGSVCLQVGKFAS